ncbi:MAG: alpha/beta hydrolase [Eggerthellaceae bacterium]|nr:alpha/beta hydrolase [Eggerthellaceae bacterium]
MKYVDINRRAVFPGANGACAPVIYVVDAEEHPFDIDAPARGRACTIVKVCVRDWNDSLTPWRAPGIYRGNPDFAGNAAITLSELVSEAADAVEHAEGLAPSTRAICGYSLGGLFALYAFTHTSAFAACACLSGSVWYEGWVDHLRGLAFDGAGRFAFLSIGSKEKHAAPKILHHVQDDMAECAAILRERGCETEFAVGPGGHMSFVRERFDAGLSALDRFLA